MPRLIHTAVSFAIVLMAYLIYARVAVPLIEPSIAGPSGTIAGGNSSETGADQRIAQLEKIFPPGALDLKKTKVLENDKVMILLENYKNLDDGRVKLEPCTMVFLWDGPAEDEAQRLRQSIILQAPEGAILKFDKPIDLSSLKIGRLVGGSLLGKITISSQGKSPGPEDDLLIHTSEVQLNEQEVWTLNQVEFTWGKNSGSGRDMHIKLLADPSKIGEDRNAPSVTGVELFEMRHIKGVHLESAPSAQAGTSPAPNQTNGLMSAADFSNQPIDITCDGPFTFNVVKRVASFADKVFVYCVNPNGPSDQIQSELLSIYFLARDNSKPDSDNLSNLEPERIEARGHSVTINAPTKNLTGQAERLEYNIKTKLISLDGGPEVFLRQGTNKIHGQSLQYQSLGQNSPGRAAAQGPGWLIGQFGDNPQSRIEARWNDKLHIEPKDQYQVISFTGGAVLNYPGFGILGAKEIFFWLKQTPSGGPRGQSGFMPNYMKAQNQVTIDSTQLTAALEQQLEVWFEQKDTPHSPSSQSSTLPANQGQNAAANQSQAASARPEASRQHFKISGGKLQARMILNDQQIEDIVDLVIQDGVRLEETQTSAPDQRPILIQGDRLHGTNLFLQNTVVKVTGRPAHCEARGLGLTGSNINLNKGINRLWIEGPGRMDVPLSDNMFGQSIAAGQPKVVSGTLLIDWQKGMDFDGSRAKFEESVSASTPQFHLQTSILEAKLKRPISFSDSKLQDQDQNAVENLSCWGGVFLENHSIDIRGQPISYDRMQVADLAINLQSGALSAGGPGWLNRVFLNSVDHKQNQLGAGLLGGRPATPAVNNVAPNSDQPNNQLYCLHVRFQGSIKGSFPGLIAGNVNQGEVIFKEQIGAAYAPVFDWSAMIDPEKQDKLGPKGIALHCNQLKINQMPLPAGKGQTIEAEASENAVAEGGDGVFTARAHRITYSEAKNLLILEGNGRTLAELYRQKQPGAPLEKTSFRKFEYNLKTNSIRVIDARSLEITPGKN
ncbi:MAG: LptA/OstA family protein [Thermoguttaceae bacterium]|jgi:lipopolysaccharide export system protein LptA